MNLCFKRPISLHQIKGDDTLFHIIVRWIQIDMKSFLCFVNYFFCHFLIFYLDLFCKTFEIFHFISLNYMVPQNYEFFLNFIYHKIYYNNLYLFLVVFKC